MNDPESAILSSSPKLMSMMFKNGSKTWIPDGAVQTCPICTSTFGWFTNRRHHCRICLGIFCGNCCCDYICIPKELRTTCKEFAYTDSDRVCKLCNEKVFKIAQTQETVKKILKTGKTIQELIESVDEHANDIEYLTAIEYIQAKFIALRYNLYNDLDPVEILIIKNNYKQFRKHHKLVIITAKYDIEIFKELLFEENVEEKCVCKTMMCSKNCREDLLTEDYVIIMNLLMKRGNTDIELFEQIFQKAISGHTVFDRCDSHGSHQTLQIQCIPTTFLFRILMYFKTERIFNLILTKINDKGIYDGTFAGYFFWLLNYHKSDLKYYLDAYTQWLDTNNPDLYRKILSTNEFINKIKEFDSAEDYRNRSVPNDRDIYLPFDYGKFALPLMGDFSIKQLDSYTKPLLITFNVTGNRVLYKKEDMMKEMLISELIKFCRDRLYKSFLVESDFDSGGYNMEIYNAFYTYDIVPINKDAGFIQISTDCLTLNEIKTKYQSILHYIFSGANSYDTMGTIKNRFIISTAAYSVISYIFGIGDRHSDNIMITRDGRMFHIDYGYVFGDDPQFYNKPQMKLTDEIINTLGGTTSPDYINFESWVVKFYNCLRKHIDLFIAMINPDSDVLCELLSRFIPDQSKIIAERHIISKVRETNYTDVVRDILHDKTRIFTPKYVMSMLGF